MSAQRVIGVDLGGTKIATGSIDADGTLHEQHEVATPTEPNGNKPVTARNDASVTRRKPKTLAPLRKVEPLSQPTASSAPVAPSQDQQP